MKLPSCENSRSRFGRRVAFGRVYFWMLATLILLPTNFTAADITLPKFFSDHMVLQQESLFPVWGTAEPNQELLIRFNGAEVEAVAADDGSFSISIETPSAGGPYTLEIEDQNQTNKVVLTDVMVGDVWLCAGQTNMSLPVSEALNAETEIAQSKKHTSLRLFRLEPTTAAQPADDVTTLLPWANCSPESVKDFSAVAYFFGRELGKSLDKTPIGLIDASVDGSTCEAWCSDQALNADLTLAPLLSHWEENEDLEAPNRPGSLFNGIISPLSAYPVKGVIWYQGETNVGRGKQYGHLLKSLIGDWRQHFSNAELPFYFVQIAPFRYSNFSSEALPELWDAQLRTVKSVRGTAMVPTMDLGAVDQMYPKNKQVIGQRLAKLAWARTYQATKTEPTTEKSPPVTGPVYEALAYREGKIRVTFREVGSGLKVIGDSPLGSFTICGPDEVFHPAVATIVGPAAIELASDLVEAPKAVRYCWDDSAKPSLANSADLPAFPFRTDSQQLKSEETAF